MSRYNKPKRAEWVGGGAKEGKLRMKFQGHDILIGRFTRNGAYHPVCVMPTDAGQPHFEAICGCIKRHPDAVLISVQRFWPHITLCRQGERIIREARRFHGLEKDLIGRLEAAS